VSNGTPSSTPIVVEPPWKQSAKGSVYCDWESLPANIKSQLKLENRYSVIIEDSRYYVRQYENGDTIVYRNPKMQYEATKQQYFNKKTIDRTTEVQVLPLEQANKLLSSSNEYELLGTDPIKVVNDQFFAVIGRKEKGDEHARS
jgi:hypothetical protein